MTHAASGYDRPANDLYETPLTADVARSLLSYSKDSGRLYWRTRPVSMFAGERAARSWNAKHAFLEAGWSSDDGYIRVTIFGDAYKAHRVAWLIETGAWPPGRIDHEDRDRSNNRWGNIRVASARGNARNRSLPSNNTSGHIGVNQRADGSWYASIKVDGRRLHLGRFSTCDAAVAARRAGEERYCWGQVG